ncbi:MAG: HDOD domain-containing protein [Myxococcota bacterium]
MLTANHELQDCLDRVDRLGVFPAAAAKILEMSRHPDATLDQLEKAVEMDSVLAARILKVANSPFYVRTVRVGTLRRALQMLGFTGTRDIAIALAIASVSRDRLPVGQSLWYHAMATAWACRVIARHGRGLAGDALFVGGMLHDLGQQLLLAIESDITHDLIAKYGPESDSYVKAEQDVFGFDHSKLAGECLRRWKLPLEAVELVERHHEPVEEGGCHYTNPRARAVLAVADHIAYPLIEGLHPAALFDRAMAHPAAPTMRVARGGLMAALETLVEHRDSLILE